jgi:hypothetical protein
MENSKLKSTTGNLKEERIITQIDLLEQILHELKILNKKNGML